MPFSTIMVDLIHISQRQLPQLKPTQRLVAKLRLAELIVLPEKKFAELIKEIENDPLFLRLVYPENKEEKAISYRKFLQAGISQNLYELKEEVIQDKTIPDVESILANKKEIIRICRSIGVDRFNKYFLYNEENLSLKEIATLLGLKLAETKKVFSLINEIAIHSEFYNPSSLNIENQIHYTKIASIDKNANGDLSINFFSPVMYRGKYVVNYDKIEQLKKKNAFTQEERQRLNKLLNNLELVNHRKITIYQVIENIVNVQKQYLNTGNIEDLISFTQKELSEKIHTHPSVVSRAIAGRSLVTPWQEEKPLKYFLPNRKVIIKNLIQSITETEEKRVTDEEIKNILQEKHNLTISRRSVNVYRQELKIHDSTQRKK